MAAELRLGVKLPAALLDLLRIRNGGYTQSLVFPTAQPNSYHEAYVPFYEMNGVASGGEFMLWNSAELAQRGVLPPQQIVLSGDGHYFVTLDYRRGPEPCVTWIDTEMDQEFPLAGSFAEFAAGLIPAPDEE